MTAESLEGSVSFPHTVQALSIADNGGRKTLIVALRVELAPGSSLRVFSLTTGGEAPGAPVGSAYSRTFHVDELQMLEGS